MTKQTKQRIEMINRGEVPDGYKKTKVGIVPKEWERYKLSAISAEIIETAGNNLYETLSISAGIGFVNQANKFGKELSGNQYSKYIVLKKGDFSYNKGNSKKYPQGCIYQLNDRDCAAVPNIFESFRLTNGVNNYYEQLFVSGFMNGQLFSKINHGVRDDGLLNLKSKDFYSSYVPSPPLPEQEKIAEILTTQDKVIKLKQNLINEKKQQKKWLLQQLLTGVKRLKGFSGEWKKVRLGEVCTTVTDYVANGSFADIAKNVSYLSDGYAILLRTLDYNNGFTKEFVYVDKKAYDYLRKSAVYENDIIISNVGSVGIVFKAPLLNKPLTLAPNAILVRSAENNEYLFQMFISPYGRAKIKDITSITAQPKFNKTDFKQIKISLPPLPEQTAISEILSAQDKEIELLEKDLEQEKQKKKALMQLLLTGKVRVNV